MKYEMMITAVVTGSVCVGGEDIMEVHDEGVRLFKSTLGEVGLALVSIESTVTGGCEDCEKRKAKKCRGGVR